MARKRKRTGLLIAAGVGTAVALAAFAAGAAAPPVDDDEDDDYTGPGPNRPPGKRKPEGPEPSGPKSKRPSSIAPADLWVSPTCDDLMLGPDWFAETAMPAIEAWVADGYGQSPGLMRQEGATPDEIVRGDSGAVVREVLGPYSPLCIDVFPWDDVYESTNPIPEWEAPDGGPAFNAWHDQREAAHAAWDAENGPALTELIVSVEKAVRDEWMRQYEGGGASA